jgi:VWFA-related protein
MHTRARTHRFPLVAAGLVAAAAAAHASAPGAEPQRRFIGGVELVAVDFVAVDDTGQPVRDLRQEEVSVRIDGRSRVVRSLQFVEVARMPAPTPGGAPPPPPYGSNSLADAGRSFVIVIDDESFRPGKESQMRDAVAQFLGALSKRDRVAVVTVPHGSTRSDLTTDHQRVNEILKTVVGHAPQQLDASEEACRTRRTLESLDGLMRGISNPDGPTHVLFFSSSMLAPRRDAASTRAPGMCEITSDHFRYVGEAAGNARAQFYVIMPTESMPNPAYEVANFNAVAGSANPLEGLEHLAGVTGGRRMTLATMQERPLDRVLVETSGYYIIAFEPEPSDRNAEHHGLQIDVSRPGVNERARPSIAIAAARPDDPIPTLTPADMLREARVYRDLPLRVTGYVSRGATPEEPRIVVYGEAVDAEVALVASSAGLFDQQGRLVAQWTANSTDLGRRASLGALTAPPGVYRLRFAARDADGRTGTADTEIDVQLPSGSGFTLSSVVLGLSRPMAADAPVAFQPRLEFTTEPVAIAYVEVYGGQAGDRVGAQVEMAMSADGPAIVALPLALEPTSEPNRFRATGAVPIGTLKPGDYVVRILVGPEGQPATLVMRTLRKTAG